MNDSVMLAVCRNLNFIYPVKRMKWKSLRFPKQFSIINKKYFYYLTKKHMKVSISLLNQDPEQEDFEEILKRNPRTIIYFYPKDDTPWCTIEAKDFSDKYIECMKHNISVYGISKDPDKSHCNFISKHGLSIPLISDPELILHKKFGAWWEKNMYGKKVQWTIRSTFLLDQDGKILKEWNNVKAAGHVEKIMKEIWLE